MDILNKKHMAPHRCTMCKRQFIEELRTGRPSAFCSPECRAESRKTKNRYCRICKSQFTIGPWNDNNPFYCSEECRALTLCHQCYKPTSKRHRFCSVKCMQDFFPPPYACANPTCKSPTFYSSGYYLNRDAALIRPPKYCSSECYIASRTPTHPSTSATFQRGIDYDIAMAKFKDSTSIQNLPLPRNKLPWMGITPTVPIGRLHVRSRNTIAFWQWAIDEYLTELIPLEYTAFLFEFVCRRSSPHPKHVELQPCWTLWPYIEPHLDDRYVQRLFRSWCSNSLYAERAYFRDAACLPPARLDILIMQCASLGQQYRTDKKSLSGRDRKFAEQWLRPLLEHNAAYPHKDPERNAHYSSIQLELMKTEHAIGAMMDSELRTKVLDPLPWKEYMYLAEVYRTIMEIYAKTVFKNKAMTIARPGKWPWGPNCYDALLIAHRPALLDEVKIEMRTTGKYNLPEPR